MVVFKIYRKNKPLYFINYVRKQNSTNRINQECHPKVALTRKNKKKGKVLNMLNMPLNELWPLWHVQSLLSPKDIEKLKTIKYIYYLWKDYFGRDDNQDAQWNSIKKKVREREA